MATGLREDVRDLITVLSPVDTPAFSMLGDSQANNTRHEWLSITVPTGADNKHIEGTAWAYASADVAAETRYQNYTQIMITTFRVAGSVEAVGKYGRSSEYDFRRLNALKGHAVDIENELLENTASAAGDTGTSRDMKGIPGAAMDGGVTATAHSTATSRSALSVATLNALLQSMWDQGTNPDTIVCGSGVKRAISAFSGADAGRPVVLEDGKKIFTMAVDVFETDFGRLAVVPSRRINPGSQLLAFDRSLLSKAWLRPTFVEYPAKDGDYLPGVIVSELTLEYLNPLGVGRLTRVLSA